MTSFQDRMDGRNNHFNLIRVLAAFGVLISHAWPLSMGMRTTEPLQTLVGYKLGTLSVFVFFAISGFFITRSFDLSRDWKSYLIARCLRIFPALAVVLGLTVLVSGALITTAPFSEFWISAVKYLIKNMSLFRLQWALPGVFEDNIYPKAINGSLWTLSHEFRLYGLVLLVGVFRSFDWPVLLRFIALAFVVYLQCIPATTSSELATCFVIGAVIYLWRNHMPASMIISVLLVVVAIASKGTTAYLPILLLTISYSSLALGYYPFKKLLAYNRLGDYSYGIYIYAFPMQQLASHFGADTPVENILFAAVPTITMAILSWHLIEGPALGMKNTVCKWLFREKAAT